MQGGGMEIANWGTADGLNYDLIDPTSNGNPTEPTVRSRITSTGGSLWCQEDGVHLSREGYQDLAWAIREAADSEFVTNDMSCSSDGSKRKRSDSIVTLPRTPLPKRGRGGGTPSVAGWLRGVADLGRSNRGPGGPAHLPAKGGCERGRGRGRFGWRRSWRGRSGRW
jgi:hypothetical protein